MYYEDGSSVDVKQTEQRQYSMAYQIHDGLLYHYAKCDTLWRILESDSFFARNIRFSNDSNEYMTGRTTIERFVKRQELEAEEKNAVFKQIREDPMLYFMVCFCMEGDLLSQWRGYAKNGVSLGLDFTDGSSKAVDVRDHVEYFCVRNSREYEKTLEPKLGKEKYYIGDKEPLIFLQMPYKVAYIDQNKKILPREIKSVLSELWEKGGVEERVNRLLKYIPFIKDIGFAEEEECRLIFDMEYLGGSKAHSNSVRSKKIGYIDDVNIKMPYINVEFGRPEEKLSDVSEVYFGEDVYDIAGCLQQSSDTGTYPKIIREQWRRGICIGEGKNQEEILEVTEKAIEASESSKQPEADIKVWCKGHLPIRRIIVGPGEKQKEIKESLEFYRHTVYWLRYIDIEESKIPLRS